MAHLTDAEKIAAWDESQVKRVTLETHFLHLVMTGQHDDFSNGGNRVLDYLYNDGSYPYDNYDKPSGFSVGGGGISKPTE